MDYGKFVGSLTGKKVLVRTGPSEKYIGTMVCFDDMMNVYLKEAELSVDGVVTDKPAQVLIRGSTVTFIELVE